MASVQIFAQEDAVPKAKPIEVLLITGGCCHDYDFQTKALQLAAKEHQVPIAWTVVDQGGKGTRAMIDFYKNETWYEGFDVVVHNECFADTDDPDYIRSITKPHFDGVNALVIHCAMHTYRSANIDDWREFLGVTTRRHDHQSHYPVKVTQPNHPIMRDFPTEGYKSAKDELYIIEKVWPKTTVLATSPSERDGKEYPVYWTNQYGKGRVFGTTYGHSNETFTDPVFLRAIIQGIQWAASTTATSIVGENQYSVQRHGDKVDVLDDGKLVTSYQYRSGSKPILWPIHGPDSVSMTRAYPMVPDSVDEKHDHPHHRGLWMNFGEINQFDLWAEGKGAGFICQVGDPTVEVTSSGVTIGAKNLWKGGIKDTSPVSTDLSFGCDDSTELLAESEATYVIHGDAQERAIDCYYTLTAAKDLHFGDTKEGMFAIRVPEAMKVDAGAGRILASNGKKNGETWGYPAKWVDYSGKASKNEDKEYGIAILIHPTSFGAEGRWHVRTYGLFAHNAFGVKDFPKMENPPKGEKAGGYEMKKGESITFRYRVLLHRGAYDLAKGNERWEAFAKKEF